LYWKGIAKRQKGGKVRKNILKRQGAQGGILHKPENVTLSKQIITKNPEGQPISLDFTGRQRMEANVAQPTDCHAGRAGKHTKRVSRNNQAIEKQCALSKRIKTMDQKIENQD